MKKIITVVMMIATIAAFAQMEISRNRVMGMLGLGYELATTQDTAGDDVSDNTMVLMIPDVSYEFEGKPSDMFKLYFYADLGFNMFKNTEDGDAQAGQDAFGNQMYLNLGPAAKVYLPNNLFVKLDLPFHYDNVTPQLEEDAGDYALSDMYMNMKAAFGYDTRELYIHGLTPYDKFEKGILGYAFYDMQLMRTSDVYVTDPVTFAVDVESVDAEELPSYFGIYGAYAHYVEAMMIKPYLSYKMGMNDKVDEDSYLHIGANFAKDFNEKLNIQANLDFGMWMLADAPTGMEDAYNTLNIDASGMYYVMPELAVGAGFGMEMDLTTEDANPVYMIMLGAEYTMNLLK